MCTCTFVGVYNCKPIGVDMASEICLRSFLFYFNFFYLFIKVGPPGDPGSKGMIVSGYMINVLGD